MSATTFLVELLVRAGLSRALALQLAQAYLAAHGVPYDATKAVEEILEELQRSGGPGGSIVGQHGGVDIVSGGGSDLAAGLLPAAPSSPTQALGDIFEALASSSQGTVSSQALSSYNLTFAQALGVVSYQVGSQTGQDVQLDSEIYNELEQGGLLDAPDLV